VYACCSLLLRPHSHVQLNNEEAIHFYQRFGFKIAGTKEDYYKRIDPPHAYILEKDLSGEAARNGSA